MKLSLVFGTFASIIVLATAYPTQEHIAKRSNVEMRKELDSDLFGYVYKPMDEEKREELDYVYKRDEEKREELEELDSDLVGYVHPQYETKDMWGGFV